MTNVIREYTTAEGVTIRIYSDGTTAEEYPDPPVKTTTVQNFRDEIASRNLENLTQDEMTVILTKMHDDAISAIPYYENLLTNWATLTADEKDRLLYNLTRSTLQSIRYLTGKLT